MLWTTHIDSQSDSECMVLLTGGIEVRWEQRAAHSTKLLRRFLRGLVVGYVVEGANWGQKIALSKAMARNIVGAPFRKLSEY